MTVFGGGGAISCPLFELERIDDGPVGISRCALGPVGIAGGIDPLDPAAGKREAPCLAIPLDCGPFGVLLRIPLSTDVFRFCSSTSL